MGQRGVDFQGLLGDLALLRLRQVRQRPHIVGAVGQLNENHADVARHGDDHLAEVLGLTFFTRGEIDLTDLGDPIHQGRDLQAELFLDLFQAGEGVLNRVVQQAGHDTGDVELHVGDDLRHLDGMHEIGIARAAFLPLVHALGKGIGPRHEVGVRFRMVRVHLSDEFA